MSGNNSEGAKIIVCHEPGCNQMKKTFHNFRCGDGHIKGSKLRHFQAFPGPLFTHTVWLFYVNFEEKRLVINFLWLEL